LFFTKKVAVSLVPDQPQKGTKGASGPKPLSEHVGELAALNSLKQPKHHSNEQDNSNALSPREILDLINSGEVAAGLKAAREVYDRQCSLYSEKTQVRVNSLVNLLEFATRTNTALPDLSESVRGLEKVWTSSHHERDLAANRMQIAKCEHEISSATDLEPSSPSAYVMRVLSRVCEYAAQAGRRDLTLRGLAERSLECLTQIAPFFSPSSSPELPSSTKTSLLPNSEPEQIQYYAASAAIRASAHIASWKVRDEKPDLRGLRFMAERGYYRLAEFSEPTAKLYYALFKCESGHREAGLQMLEELTEAPAGVHIDVRIAALDQVTGWYIRFKEFQKARASLDSLREALRCDSASPASTVQSSFRVRAIEALRVQSYQGELDKADRG